MHIKAPMRPLHAPWDGCDNNFKQIDNNDRWQVAGEIGTRRHCHMNANHATSLEKSLAVP